MRDFWLACGHHLTERNADGHLLITDEFLKAYLARPELAPPPEACAVELFFRPQRLTMHEGALIGADEETLGGTGAAALSPLVSMLGISAAAEIDILTGNNAESYWGRSDLFDMAFDLTAGRRGPTA